MVAHALHALYVTHNLAEAVRLGHRIAILSRRPGRIREIVEIDRPLAERGLGDPELEAHQKRLWRRCATRRGPPTRRWSMAEADEPPPARRRAVSRRRVPAAAVRFVGLAVFVVLIGLIEWGTRAGWISSLTLPRPSDVLAAFGELYRSGALWEHLSVSLTRLVMGSAMG